MSYRNKSNSSKDRFRFDFTTAKNLYIKGTQLPETSNHSLYDNSKYADAARKGLCFKCFYDGPDLNRRPSKVVFGFCKQCMIEQRMGVEKLEAKNWNEVDKWFGD